MLKQFAAVSHVLSPLTNFLSNKINPVIDLLIRLVIANIFFKSGMLKLNDLMNGNFQSQIFLFKDTYNLPLIPPDVAAYLAMGGELACSILFAIGFITRFSAAGILIMTGLAIYVFPDVFEHFLWALLVATILCRGAGPLSIDYLLFRRK